ncbi:hypothetical protein Clacol_005766 [Clathrus columnatus]|uniref:LisH domain-containing protein n=1 Tax=Clathrus columnatus TaxID=1419009 RepID=A0AAV5AD55_9AGAM|nr:hypothetical protein Clacol_005766 [Clathrus columnatus]
MAQVQPSPPNPSHPNINGQPGPSPPNHSQPPISWEGDQMFNVYIHDYFIKRGFHRTAKELVIEADIGSDAYPPINARQGFLFEPLVKGQTMFYFIFKQWIQSQADRNRAADPSRPGLPGQPRLLHRGGPPQNPMRPSGPMVNGVSMPPVGQSQPPIGAQGMPYPMPGLSGVPQQPQHQQPQAGPSQVTGIMDSHNPLNNAGQNPQRPPSQQQPTRPGTQQPLPPPSHPNAMPHLQPGQRPGPRSHNPGQFQSPTMTPAHPPGVPPHPSMAPPHMGMVPPGIPQNPPHMAQHSHLMRNPPQTQGGQQANNPSPRGPSQTPTQGYQQPLMNPGGAIGPPPQGSGGSRSVTPATTTIINHRSPSMSSLPNESASPGQSMNDDINRRFQMSMQVPRPPQQSMIPSQPQQSQGAPQQLSRPGTSQPISTPEFQRLEQDLARIPPVFLASVKQEAGVPDRDYGTLTDEEKARVNEAFKKIISNFNGTLTPGSRNVRPGASQPQPMTGAMPPPPQAPQLRQQQGPQTQGPGATQRGQKRTSTSPGDEQADTTPKDQSPPDRKRQRPSPQVGMGQSNPLGGDMNLNVGPQTQMTPMSGSPGHPTNHPGGTYPGPGASHLANGFRAGQMGNGPISGHSVPTGPHVNAMPMGSLTPSMGHAMPPPGGMAPMNPAMTNQHIHIHQMPGSQNPALPQQQGAFRHPITPGTHMHKMPGAMGGMTNQGVAPDQGNRAQSQQNKPGSMMPPPSPGHRPESINVPKSANMMPPPQPAPGSSTNSNTGSAKDQTAPSPARLDPPTGSSPSMRPASRSGAGMSAPQNSNQPSNSQNAPGNPPTPVPPGTVGSNSNNPSNALSPSVLSNRISPNAAIGSLSRPQPSGPDNISNAQTNSSNPASIANGSPAPAPPPPSSAPPSSSAPSLTDSIFTGFFDTMEDNFNLDGLEIDPSDFSQWIDMNPIN